MKEHAAMVDVVEKYREYKKANKDLEQAKEMLNDKELKELAEMEIEEIKEKLPKIEEELKKELSVIKNKTKYNITEILNDKSFLELIIEKIYITKDKNIELYLNFNNLS